MSSSILTPDLSSNPTSLSFGSFNPYLTIGAIEIGVLVSTCLFGLVTAQVYVYMYRFPKDPKLLKILVPFVWVLELGHTICICQALFAITISQYGKPELLDIPPESLNVAILLSGFIGPIEQGWFAHRIYKFSKSSLIPVICVSLSVIRFVGSISLATVAFHRLTVEDYVIHWAWLLTTILVVGAATDVMLAAALCYYLHKWHGKRDAFKRTSRLISTLMLWTIETGLLTSIGAIVLLFLTMRNTFVWIGIFSVLARLFSNSFLASLNARPTLSRIYQEDVIRITENEAYPSLPQSPTTPMTYPVLEMNRISGVISLPDRQNPLLERPKSTDLRNTYPFAQEVVVAETQRDATSEFDCEPSPV